MYSSYVFIAENRKLLPAFGHHMFVREDFSQDKDISHFHPIPRLFIWVSEIIIPIKMGPKKKY